MSDKRPIGLLDSGLGGLTVTKEVIKQMSNEDIVFIGDEARMPYGLKTKEQIIEYTRELVKYLISQDVKVIIYACNTATANALPTLKKEFSIPMFGVIEPGAITASRDTKTNNVGVIGTKATINSKSYSKAIDDIDPNINVLGVPAQEFVSIVENDEAETKQAQELITDTLKPFLNNKYDTLVLGCTHFPMLRSQIVEALGNEITLVDSGIETVSYVRDYLRMNDMLTDTKDSDIRLHATGGIDEFKRLSKEWLAGTKIDEISLVNLGENK
ncbi:glutamate racemase [Companilactobacillus allii]|uniref:Glutamate racemase n=1 Tax=Companilactobacillus allii TaxID=1847728 RepID=A0A1P8PZQ4_9LACO|nr:glutamate racemase [Companilactobacillus allii]APX71046.1 glutamate racemase [Companilactobacillus allii]USQ68124.1 glutamate racemase [Companilactobacillus allii]